ncbi:hypothetical protein NEDG_00077 [Nematocida displodere]|uniref:Uncharacterized protein n=1 Tax=Nematocida displodere TaxID=1805483 RepID=A0A177EKF1_9MICR|nr:hypothetical protein NEDG_00077 [Nematocida displodere]
MDGASGRSMVFELINIMRYSPPVTFPENTPHEVYTTIKQHIPVYLYDIYLTSQNVPICALLHPGMYQRVLKGWLKIGSRIRITKVVADMIAEIEVLSEPLDAVPVLRVKKELFAVLAAPVYNPKGFYIPLLNDDGYVKWDKRWEKVLKAYTPKEDDKLITPPDISKDLTTHTLSGLFQRAPRIKDTLGYTSTKKNLMKGRVLLKSKLFPLKDAFGATHTPFVFSFVFETSQGIAKVYVWGTCVWKFFCLREGDPVIIRGFKVKRSKGSLALGDRTISDTDTRYATIPEITINSAEPTGEIEILDESLLDEIVYDDAFTDKEFATVAGTVEYVSSLLRWKEAASHAKTQRVREFVYLRVAGTVIKLFSNGPTEDILGIHAGQYLEVRHLRKCTIGAVTFYISSLYTQFYPEECPHTNKDALILSATPKGLATEGGIGYLPLSFTTLEEHNQNSLCGLGPLYIQGASIPETSPNSAYLRKEQVYFGSEVEISALGEKTDGMYMDEIQRFIIKGDLLEVNSNTRGGNPSKDLCLVSYMETEHTLEDLAEHSFAQGPRNVRDVRDVHDDPSGVSERSRIDLDEDISFVDKNDQGVVLRIGQGGSFVDVHVFRNHLVSGSTFTSTVCDFLKVAKPKEGINAYLQKRIGEFVCCVVDAVRLDDTTVLYIGVTMLDL